MRQYLTRAIHPLAKIAMRELYARALAAGDSSERKQRLSTALRWRRYAYPPGGRLLEIASLKDGGRLWVNLCELEGANLYFGAEFEPVEIAIVKRVVQPGDTFFDVGANVGVFTLAAGRQVGETGSVHAFEPAEFAHELLVKNLRLNGLCNVVVNRLAVSEGAGESNLLVNRESGLSSLGDTRRGQVVGTQRVRTISLDEYVRREQMQRVAFMKIDVEGFEGHVLRGARDLIEREGELTIMCELAEKNFRPLSLSVDDVVRWMSDRGYAVWEVNRGLGCAVRRDAAQISRQNQNFVFVRPGSRGEQTLVAMAHETGAPARAER